ncbi:MAG TPA: hypothetical protein VLA49_16950 [Anaerolineales bacterium]|nr:hypothetical protein [Anaerolineales bacterium]
MTSKRFTVLVLTITAILLVGTTGVLANPDYNVEVPDRTGFAQAALNDGAIVQYIGDLNTSYGASGSGVFNPFVRLQGNDKKTTDQKGYNTDGTREFDTKAGTWTHSILLSEIPTVLVGDNVYWEFWSDINDSDSTPLISLDDFELYLTDDPNLSGYPFTGFADLIYDYTAANNGDYILINDVNQGSGRGDLRYLVPVSDTGVDNCDYGNPACTTYLVLYSVWGGKGIDGFGNNYGFDGGFEEWKVKIYPKLLVSKDINGAFDTPVSWNITKESDATYDLFTGESQAHAYAVTVDPILGDPENTEVYGTITILGDEDDPVDATITDFFNGAPATITGCSVPQNGDGTYTIAANATVTCSYELSLGDVAPVDGTNLARASFDFDSVSLAFQGSVDILAGAYVESFTGYPDITVDDDNLVGEDWSASYTSSETWNYELTFSCDDDEGDNTNTATINENPAWSDDATVTINCYSLNVTKTADEFYSRYFEWDITKSVTPASWDLFTGESGTSDYTVVLDRTGFYENDWQVTGDITIANSHPTRAVDLTGVIDDAGGIAGVVDCGGATSVPASGSLDCTYATAVQDAEDANPFGDTNTATVTQQLYDFASDGTATPDGTKDYSGTSSIDFAEATVELVDEEATVSDTYASSTVSGTYTDDKTFTYSRTFSCDGDEGPHDNTASFETNDTPLSGSDDASVTVSCYDLSVTKTADESYTRYYEWYIDKAVNDEGPITVAPGDSVTLDYTVVVGVLGFTENDWRVTGDITIANSHPDRDADLTLVTDVADYGIGASVICPSYVVPAGGSLDCTYDTGEQISENLNPFGPINTATATQQLYDFASDGTATPDGTKDYSGTSLINFAEATVEEVDEEVDVDDSYAGFLGTCAEGDAPCTFFYSRTVTADPFFCGSFTVDNTATFTTNDTGTTGNDDVSVTIDVPCLGCTPGFWQGGAGSQLWDEVNDPQWMYGGTNPFIHTTLFNDFFNTATDPRLDGQTMFQIVSNEGGNANSAERAARDMVAAYLNESAFPDAFPADSLEDLVTMWYEAVAGGDAGLDAFHTLVSGWNDPPDPGYCPLP